MIRDDLQKLYPKALQLIENSYKKDRLSHAYIFHGENIEYELEMAKYLAKILYCGLNFDDNNPTINQIETEQHLNVNIIRPSGKTVKKEQIMALQEEYSKTSQVDGPRFYIILEADTMTLQAANSLLKFIEEPQGKETYGILITRHLDNIIQTIRSRSIAVSFEDNNKILLKEELVKSGLSLDKVELLTYLNTNFEDANKMVETDYFDIIFNSFNLFLEQLKNENILLFVRACPMLFNNRDNVLIFLSLLEGLYRNFLEYKENDRIGDFKYYEDILKEIAEKYERAQLIDCLNHILRLEKQLPYYVNINLNMNELLMTLAF